LNKNEENGNLKITNTKLIPNANTILTHVIDGYVIKESSKPFPVKPLNKTTSNDDQLLDEENSKNQSPKSTSTPSSNLKRTSSELKLNSSQTSSSSKRNKSSKKPKPNENNDTGDELSDRLNNSKLLDDTNLNNTSLTSHKSSSSKLDGKKHRHHKHHHHHHHSDHHKKHNSQKFRNENGILDDSNTNGSCGEHRLSNFRVNGEKIDSQSGVPLLLPPPPPPPLGLQSFSPQQQQQQQPQHTGQFVNFNSSSPRSISISKNSSPFSLQCMRSSKEPPCFNSFWIEA
jgi:hypothetical protein